MFAHKATIETRSADGGKETPSFGGGDGGGLSPTTKLLDTLAVSEQSESIGNTPYKGLGYHGTVCNTYLK